MKTFIRTLFLCSMFGAFFASCEEELIYHQVALTSTAGGEIEVNYFDPQYDIVRFCQSNETIGLEMAEGYTARVFVYQIFEDYVFVGWYEEGTKLVSTESYYCFEAYNDFSLTAKFVKQSSIVLDCTMGGKVAFKETGGTYMKALPGDSVTVIATADEGYSFIGWYAKFDNNEYLNDGSEDRLSETIVSTDNIYTFEVSEDVELFAKFAKKVVVSLDVSGNGEARFEDSSETSKDILPETDITVVATPDVGFGFKGWFIVNGVNESLISTDAIYTITVSEGISLIAKFYRLPEMVDLGLSVKWANFNVGASSPEEYGGYYAWGETQEKSRYDFEGYEWCYGSIDFMTKYCVNCNDGTVDGKYVLELEDDVAHMEWSGDWRMPTTAEQRELCEKCTWEWTTLNGVNGRKVTGPNGNSIFLPAAGFKSFDKYLTNIDYGGYWSSTVCSFYSNHAYCMDMGNTGCNFSRGTRNTGFTIRPVCGEPIAKVVIVKEVVGGSIDININGNPSSTGLCAKGDMATVTATPEYGYEFIGWFVVDNPTPISTDTVYTFAVNDNVELIANFEKQGIVSISCNGNGSVSFENSTETTMIVKPNTSITVIASPEEGYKFLGWYINGNSVSTNTNYTFNVNGHVELIAEFEKPLVVSISSRGNGSVTFEDFAETTIAVKPRTTVTVFATPDDGYDFVGWNVAGSLISNKASYTFTVKKDIALVAEFMEQEEGVVHLGLPSGVKWATCNVGANSPEEYGGYYAWAETKEKKNYTWDTYEYQELYYGERVMTKYSGPTSYGPIGGVPGDGKEILDSHDDVASVEWGSNWRMPTYAEMEELMSECSWEWTSLNGVNGYNVIGPNGNSIFLPAAGYRSGQGINGKGEEIAYWTSSLFRWGVKYAYYGNGDYTTDYTPSSFPNKYRYFGMSVRPVRK